MAHSKELYGQQTFSVRPQIPAHSTPRGNVGSPKALEKTRQPIFRGYVNGHYQKYPSLPSKARGEVRVTPPAPDHQRAAFQIRFTEPIGANNAPSSSRETSVSVDDGPPTKRVKKHGSLRTRPTRLTTRKPVNSEIHMDAWKLIFEFCEPSFLLYVIRPLCKEFRDALDGSDIWRKSRINHFGEDMPDCPDVLTEQQYVNLLVGRGCQSALCDRRETRKTYWSFMLRLCDSCFRQATRTRDHSEEQTAYSAFINDRFGLSQSEIGRTLSDLLPCGLIESGRYMGPRRMNEDQTRWMRPQMQVIVLNSDLELLKRDFNAERSKEQPDMEAWATAKWESTRQHMITVTRMHEWEQLRRDDNADLRDRRKTFFETKARQMIPPMSASILEKMSAYQNALNTTNAPSERAWSILQKKIESPKLRRQAEQLLEWDNRWLHVAEDYPKTTDILRAHRSIERYTFKSLPEELELVLKLGKEEFAKLCNQCHDQDLLLLCLRNVRRAYERLPKKPVGLSYDLSRGEYKLSLADALMVVEEVIQPRVGVSTNRGKAVLELFRCIGCTRTDCTKTRDFRDMFEHVNKTHAQVVGDGQEFWILAEPVRSATDYLRRVAWLQLPWFKNMPMLPRHQKVTNSMRWDPYHESEYIEFAESGTESAFANRQVYQNPNIEPIDLPSNFAFVAEVLRPTRLDSLSTTKIALKYAMDRFHSAQAKERDAEDNIPPLSAFTKAVEKAKQVNSRLSFKFRCGACMQDKSGSKHNRQVRSAVAFEVLEDHWSVKHDGLNNNWVENLMDLPSDSQVLVNMLTEDEKLKEDQEKCRVREAALTMMPSSKRADRKASALLELRASKDVFDQLFIRRGSQPILER